MRKKAYLFMLPFLLLAGCSQQEEAKKDDRTEILINDFENIEQLTLMKFPHPKHSDRGKMELVNEHATSGEKSLKYSNDHGKYLEVCHYFDHIVGGDIDISNIKSIDVDIFNASDFDATCTFSIYATKEMTVLLSSNFELKADELTHISMPLSKLALEFNHESIICTSLTLYMPNTDYNRGIGYTFYVDNWKAYMGSEYTEDDLENKPKIETIQEKIEALPRSEDITLLNKDALKEIADLLSPLPDLYRRVVPNIAKYSASIETYYSLIEADRVIDYDKDIFINFDEFYGSAQLIPFAETKADVFYSNDEWEGKEKGVGSTKIVFDGTTDNAFTYKSSINFNDFDFVEFKIHNSSPNYVRIWLSYDNEIFIDIAPNETAKAKFNAPLLNKQNYWAIHHLRSLSDSTIISATGAIYLSKVVATGRSQETLTKQMKYAFNCLPSVQSLVNEDDFLSAITIVATARYLYGLVLDKSVVEREKVELLVALEEKIESSGYGLAYNAYDGAMMRFSSYGEDFSAAFAIENDTFGYVNNATITKVPDHKDNPNLHEQAFTFAGEVTPNEAVAGYVLLVNNPTEYTFNLIVRSTDWDWSTHSKYFTTMELKPGWNKVNIKTALLYCSDDRKVSLFVSDGGMDLDMSGVWQFSSLFAVPRAI